MAKRRGVSSKGADWGPFRGFPVPEGRLADPSCSLNAGFVHSRAPWPTSPVGELQGFVSWHRFGPSALHPLVFEAFLEALKSVRCDSQAVVKLSSIWT